MNKTYSCHSPTFFFYYLKEIVILNHFNANIDTSLDRYQKIMHVPGLVILLPIYIYSSNLWDRSIINMEKILIHLLLIVTTINAFLFDRESLLLVPSVAFRERGLVSHWKLYNQGWYYKENPAQAFLMEKFIESIIGQDLDLDRIKMITAEGKKRQNLCINGLNRSMCTMTDDDGRIKNTFTLTNDEMELFRQLDGNGGKVLYQVSPVHQSLHATGEIYLCDDHGLTFISDIDDTIKITGVTSQTETLINTFSGQFKAVPGMSDIYREWAERYNATFAYLTASPDQLYPFLRAFFDREGFPSGSAHMRHYTWFDRNFIEFFLSMNYIQSKTEILQMFLDNTRNRTFVLLGDIFQKDPDIYANIYAQYPNRIGKIFIRKHADDLPGEERLQILFRNIPRDKWATFENGTDLPRNLFP